MKQVTIVTLTEDLVPVTETIIKQGCLHPVQLDSISDWAHQLSSATPSQPVAELRDLEAKALKLAAFAGMELSYDPSVLEQNKDTIKSLSLESVRQDINSLESKLLSLSTKKKSIDDLYDDTARMQAEFNQYKDFLDFAHVSGYSVLDQYLGRLPHANLSRLKADLGNKPHLLIPVREKHPWVTVLVFVFKKDSPAVQKMLKELSWEAVQVPPDLRGTPEEIIKKISGRHEKVEKDRKSIREQETKLKESIAGMLVPRAYFIQLQALLGEAQKYIKRTGRTAILSGWVPDDNVGQLSAELIKIAAGRCYIEIVDEKKTEIPDKKKIPFQFKTNVWLKPFQMLVQSYGIPVHGSIDPTPIFALSFIFMFGFMFGDIGDGLVLGLIGLFMTLSKKKTAASASIGALFLYCGTISIIFGFLYGSIFGFEDIIPALWLHPMHDINILLQVALYFGIGMISLGIIINIINGMRTGDWSRALFAKSGLLAGFLYWGCVGMLFKSYYLGHPTSGYTVGLIIGIPVTLLFLKAPLEKLLGIKSHHEENQGIGGYIMEMFFEVVEIFMGYLANTFSFIRVGAFALSHAGLFAAIFALSSMVRESTLGGVWSILVLFFGNILILVLEGMVVTIQAIRLEYYEFFSKFFEADGELFKPLSLRKQG
ncbi:MAG: hypothetical protein C4541_09875 [Candidatus Auribacter fodinae]|jgi:V/A-type H+-transporting ATPase subunit I|uniref:Uncharacterized protein n=1 Tax=Candidatus Auribacter fodinae TaxID=2093366 RepID=A0A3A4R7T7_9BACT|nr:MAG: hypothetical protein C4541_09875 [Candidatus Auribacter fodinae]